MKTISYSLTFFSCLLFVGCLVENEDPCADQGLSCTVNQTCVEREMGLFECVDLGAGGVEAGGMTSQSASESQMTTDAMAGTVAEGGDTTDDGPESGGDEMSAEGGYEAPVGGHSLDGGADGAGGIIDECSDGEKLCGDGSVPTDGRCEDGSEAICPISSTAGGEDNSGGVDEFAVGGDGEYGGEIGYGNGYEYGGGYEYSGTDETGGAADFGGYFEVAGEAEFGGVFDYAGEGELEFAGESGFGGASEFGGEADVGGELEYGGEIEYGGALEFAGEYGDYESGGYPY